MQMFILSRKKCLHVEHQSMMLVEEALNFSQPVAIDAHFL